MKANMVIIGAGISGASIAYNLAKKGMKDIVVIDKSFMSSGATGRCGAGIRQQWGTKMNCMLAKASVDFFENAQEILGYHRDVEFKQEGYLIVAVNQKEHDTFAKNIKLQNSLGIPAIQITKEEAKEIVPHLNTDVITSATFCPTDGHLNPFLMTDAYYHAAKKMGVEFFFYEEVKEIVVVNEKIEKVITSKRTIETNNVVNAAGGFSKEVGLMAGLDIPVYPENHEILVTEPIETIQGPMVISFAKNIYCQQVPHGGFIMGRSGESVEAGHDISSSWNFLDRMAKTVVELLPPVGNLRVVRQWGGSYDISPDRQPIIGDTPLLKGYYMACGFSGHGFMFAPMTGLLLSEIIMNEETTIDIEDLHITRFEKEQTTEYETSVV